MQQSPVLLVYNNLSLSMKFSLLHSFPTSIPHALYPSHLYFLFGLSLSVSLNLCTGLKFKFKFKQLHWHDKR